MRSRFSWRLLGSAVVLGIGLMAPHSSEGTTVTGTFRYADTLGPTCNTAYCMQPIAYTQVEVWHRGPMGWDIWVTVGRATTDATGWFTFADTRSSGTREWFGDLSPARAIRVISNTPPDPVEDPDLGTDLCFDPIRRKLVPCG